MALLMAMLLAPSDAWDDRGFAAACVEPIAWVAALLFLALLACWASVVWEAEEIAAPRQRRASLLALRLVLTRSIESVPGWLVRSEETRCGSKALRRKVGLKRLPPS